MEKTSVDSNYHELYKAGQAKGKHPTRINANTHWWDGSQIYGSSEERLAEIKVPGKCELKVEKKVYKNEKGGKGGAPYEKIMLHHRGQRRGTPHHWL